MLWSLGSFGSPYNRIPLALNQRKEENESFIINIWQLNNLFPCKFGCLLELSRARMRIFKLPFLSNICYNICYPEGGGGVFLHLYTSFPNHSKDHLLERLGVLIRKLGFSPAVSFLHLSVMIYMYIISLEATFC